MRRIANERVENSYKIRPVFLRTRETTRLWLRWADNIKTGVNEIRIPRFDWVELAQDSVQ
jgi:hypothetical protein